MPEESFLSEDGKELLEKACYQGMKNACQILILDSRLSEKYKQ